MVVDPRSTDQIEDRLKDRAAGRIAKLTNFVSTSFNRTFLSAFAEQMHELEVKLLAAQLSGFIDYSGGPVSNEDLDALGVDLEDRSELDQYLEDEHLDELAKIVGIDRDQGSKATGQVIVETASSSTEVPEGMKVATEPDVTGEYNVYLVDADSDGEISGNATVTPSQGSTSVTVDVIAEDFGTEFNTGARTVTFLPAPPTGIQGVDNISNIDGGDDPQTNDEFRDDIKNAVFQSSGGGTVEGIRGFIDENVTGVEFDDVLVDEYLNDNPVHVDVIVDGGSKSDVLDAIEESRPAGIRHELVRPEQQSVGVDVELRGEDIDTTRVQNEIEEYMFSLGLSNEFYRDQLIRDIMNADDSIKNIIALNVYYTQVRNQRTEYSSGTNTYDLSVGEVGRMVGESHMYESATNVYPLAAFPIDDTDVTLTATVGGSETTLTQGTDYDVVDDDGDGELDAIDFSVGGDTPDNQSVWHIDYGLLVSTTDETHTYSTGTDIYTLDHVPISRPGVAITDASGDQYVLGTDFDVIDIDGDGVLDSINWAVGGSNPSDKEDFYVDYELQTGTIDRVTADVSGTETDLTEDSETIVGDYNEQDADNNGYPDGIDFSVGGSDPDTGSNFTFDYYAYSIIPKDSSQGVGQKIEPATNQINITTYS